MNKNKMFFVLRFVAFAIVSACFMGNAKASEIVAYEFTWPGNTDDLFKPTRTIDHVSASEYDFYWRRQAEKGPVRQPEKGPPEAGLNIE